MSLCVCNQGRLPCTCKPIEGKEIMSDISISTGHPDAGRVYAEALDRVTAERDALQERLNLPKAAHLRSCRLAIAKNQLAKQRHAEVIALQELLTTADQQVNVLGAQISKVGQTVREAAQAAKKRVEVLQAKLAERDALLLRITGSGHQDSLRAIGEAAALSASAEPSATVKYDVAQHNSDRYVGIELAGVMREYLDMPCASLQQRMRATIERYKPHIDAMVKAHQRFPELTTEGASPE